MRVLIVHDKVGSRARPDESDAVEQAKTVAAALRELGHQHETLEVGLDLAAAARQIRRFGPEMAFNLVESLSGRSRLIHLLPSLLDALHVPYTGCPSEAIFATSNKLLAKKLLAASAIDTPAWWTTEDLGKPFTACGEAGEGEGARAGPSPRVIIKSVWEHASIGLDESSVLEPRDDAHLVEEIGRRLPQLGGQAFAEAFIEGREFNLSLLERDGGVEVLPIPEIIFEGYGAERPHMVCYRAKWDAASYEYHHTPRRFDLPPEDALLLDTLGRLARRCWDLLSLRGYARVDFRVDANGRPWVLEINTNPCLAPDAGFMAAADRAGLSAVQVVADILAATAPRAALAASP